MCMRVAASPPGSDPRAGGPPSLLSLREWARGHAEYRGGAFPVWADRKCVMLPVSRGQEGSPPYTLRVGQQDRPTRGGI